jgi:hypothetical protein
MVITDEDSGKLSNRDRTTHRVKLTIQPVDIKGRELSI